MRVVPDTNIFTISEGDYITINVFLFFFSLKKTVLWLATTQLNNTCDNRFTLCKKILRHLMSFFCWLESRPFGSNYICRIIHQLVNKNFLLLMVVLRKRNKETRKRTFPVKKDQFRDLWQMTESGVGYQRGEEVRFGGHGKLLVLPISSPPYPI